MLTKKDLFKIAWQTSLYEGYLLHAPIDLKVGDPAFLTKHDAITRELRIVNVLQKGEYPEPNDKYALSVDYWMFRAEQKKLHDFFMFLPFYSDQIVIMDIVGTNHKITSFDFLEALERRLSSD